MREKAVFKFTLTYAPETPETARITYQFTKNGKIHIGTLSDITNKVIVVDTPNKGKEYLKIC